MKGPTELPIAHIGYSVPLDLALPLASVVISVTSRATWAYSVSNAARQCKPGLSVWSLNLCPHSTKFYPPKLVRTEECSHFGDLFVGTEQDLRRKLQVANFANMWYKHRHHLARQQRSIQACHQRRAYLCRMTDMPSLIEEDEHQSFPCRMASVLTPGLDLGH